MRGGAVTEITQPFLLRYEGKDTDRHEIDAQSVGVSIVGAAKFYNAIAHFCVFGEVPRGNYRKEFRCIAKVPTEGSWDWMLVLATVAQEYNLNHEVYKEATGFLLSQVVGAIKKIWTRSSETQAVVELLTETLKHQADRNHDVQTLLINGLIKSNSDWASLSGKLIDKLPDLAASTRNSGRQMVAPIGTTCREIKQFAKTTGEVVITEPEAVVIRGGDEMEVEEMQTFRCERITEANVENGHCILKVEGLEPLVTGKIDDPAIRIPNNIYTRALNNQTSFQFKAKPVKRRGEIYRMYISDAFE